MDDYELEDTTEIAVADHPVAKWIVVMSVVIALIGLFYFVVELTPPEHAGEKAGSEIVYSVTQ